jgi:hypothetical protein
MCRLQNMLTVADVDQHVDKQVKKWRSKAYEHFVLPPAIVTMESGEIGYKFICKTCVVNNPSVSFSLHKFALLTCTPCQFTSDPLVYVTRSRTDESTSNLLRHIEGCRVPCPILAGSPHSPNFNVGHFRYLVAAWSARHARPLSIIEDEEFCDILTMLNSAVRIHSRQTVSRDISEMYHRSRSVLALHLQSVKHRLHLELDGWTSPNVYSFLGVTIRYFENGIICSHILDFVKYDGICFPTWSLT